MKSQNYSQNYYAFEEDPIEWRNGYDDLQDLWKPSFREVSMLEDHESSSQDYGSVGVGHQCQDEDWRREVTSIVFWIEALSHLFLFNPHQLGIRKSHLSAARGSIFQLKHSQCPARWHSAITSHPSRARYITVPYVILPHLSRLVISGRFWSAGSFKY